MGEYYEEVVKIQTSELGVTASKAEIEIVMEFEWSTDERGSGMQYLEWYFKDEADRTDELMEAIEDYITERHLDEEYADRAVEKRADWMDYCENGCI